ncbi:MAG: FAD-dependent thymidylate synthase [Acinetobacter junii]
MKEYRAKLSSAVVYPILQSECAITGTKITTLVCEYPRVIHAQLLTHRVFTKNSSSTRAVPLKAAIQQILDNPAKYIWTENQSGMQGKVITDPIKLERIEKVYDDAKRAAIAYAKALGDKGIDDGLNVHKQNAGRLLEPFQNIRICLTSTEWENWDWLRIDGAAQGEIQELADLIKQARDEMPTQILNKDEWHLPFIPTKRHEQTGQIFYCHPETDATIELYRAIQISMSICAQTSYRKEDCSDEKTEKVNSNLFTGNKVHASPSEHQATPIANHLTGIQLLNPLYWPIGVTHMDVNTDYWSGNFKHWIQNRQLLDNHDAAKF